MRRGKPPRALQPGKLEAEDVGQRRGREGAWVVGVVGEGKSGPKRGGVNCESRD